MSAVEGPILESDGPPAHARTPRALLRDPDVSMQGKALWTLLEDFSSPTRPEPFPGQQLLSELTGVDVRTVRRWITELEAAGWIAVTSEPSANGRRNRYRLLWEKRTSVSGGDRTSTSGGVRTSVSGGDRTSVSAEEEPVEEEPVEETPLPPVADAPESVPSLTLIEPSPIIDRFDDWYRLYPRKMKPKDARKAWRAAVRAGANPDEIVEGTRRLLPTYQRRRPEHIPYPASFLRAGEWLSVPDESREERSRRRALELVGQAQPSVDDTEMYL